MCVLRHVLVLTGEYKTLRAYSGSDKWLVAWCVGHMVSIASECMYYMSRLVIIDSGWCHNVV